MGTVFVFATKPGSSPPPGLFSRTILLPSAFVLLLLSVHRFTLLIIMMVPHVGQACSHTLHSLEGLASLGGSQGSRLGIQQLAGKEGCYSLLSGEGECA